MIIIMVKKKFLFLANFVKNVYSYLNTYIIFIELTSNPSTILLYPSTGMDFSICYLTLDPNNIICQETGEYNIINSISREKSWVWK